LFRRHASADSVQIALSTALQNAEQRMGDARCFTCAHDGKALQRDDFSSIGHNKPGSHKTCLFSRDLNRS